MNPRASVPSVPGDEPWWASFDPRRSLTARAALIVGGGAVVCTLVLAWIASATLRRELERPLGTSLEALAFQLSGTLDRTVYERSHELQFAATLTPLRSAATPPAERRHLLEALLAASPDFAWIGFATADGKIVSGTQGLLENTDAAVRPWFRGAQEQPFCGDVREVPELARDFRSPGGEPPRFLALAAPVTGTDGQFLGVLVAQLNWAWARDAQAALLTEEARRSRVSITVYSPKGDAMLDSGTSGWTEPAPAPVLPSNRRQARGFFWETISGDTEYLTGFARSRGYREFRGLGTLVAVRQPAAELTTSVAVLRRRILAWGLSLSALLAVASGMFAARVTRRLRAVGAAADRIRTGDALSLMPRRHGDQELDRMCGALDAMVEDFRAKQEKLDPEKSHPAILPEAVVKDRDVSKFV